MNLHRHEHLDKQTQNAVFALVRAATEVDGINPLSEHVELHLRTGGDEADTHFTLTDDAGEIIGYAHLDQTDAIAGPSAELVVHPRARHRGGGRMLTNELIEVAGPRLRLWSHGDLPAGESLATARGLMRVREVIQMRRSLELQFPKAQLPPAVTIDCFDPDRDVQEWLVLNARTFANHPEQSAWTADDLVLRMNEPWFNPRGFLLARREGRCIGFCWTKVHGKGDPGHVHGPGGEHGHDPIGEIYVIGVDPDHQGKGLGRLLTLAGMNYLQGIGLRTVMLYVEGDNTRALQLYGDLGFARWGKDVMYRKQSIQAPDTSI